MRGGTEAKHEIWQLRAMSWLPEEEDRERLREDGFGALRMRDRYEFDRAGICREKYFELSNADIRAAGERMARWGYGETRPMNTLEGEGSLLGEELDGMWERVLLEPTEEALIQLIQEGGRAASGACWSNDGHSMRIFWKQLINDELRISVPIRTVLFNDVLAMLEGGQPIEERAVWWLNQGTPGVLIRLMRDGVSFWREALGVEAPLLTRTEGVEEQLARAVLYDNGNLGRMLRDLIEQDLVNGILERGIENLLSRKAPATRGKWVPSGICALMGDWLIQPWWAWAEHAQGTTWDSHIACARYRQENWGTNPMYEFELTEDDRELIRSWVLQHRARFATGRWEYSPGWAFYQVPIQIFWLHGLIESEDFGLHQHNGNEMVGADELLTEHLSDSPARWVAKAEDPPVLNDLDWRIREAIVPEVERMAREFCESVEAPSSLEEDKRWGKLFRSWDYEEDASAYEASKVRKGDVLPVVLEALEEMGWLGTREALTEADAEEFIAYIQELLPEVGIGRWYHDQGWGSLEGLNLLREYAFGISEN